MFDKIFRKRPTVTVVVLILTVILSAQIAGSYMLTIDERSLRLPGFEELPDQIGTWALTQEQPLEPEVAAWLRPDDYVQREYVKKGPESSISLFAAYFKSLQNSYGPHSPRACLPASGWLVHSWQVIGMPVPDNQEPVPVNEYVLEKDGQKILVLYWYQNGRRVWAEEFQVKLHLLPDLLRYHRSDVSLIRLVTAMGPETSLDAALRQTMSFAHSLYPLLVQSLTKVG